MCYNLPLFWKKIREKWLNEYTQYSNVMLVWQFCGKVGF